MPIKTAIITGDCNHDWKRSSAFIKQLFEQSGKFSVQIEENPTAFLEDEGQLSKIDLYFIDGNGEQWHWSDRAKANYEKQIASGKGVVFLHSANNAHKGWVEFEKMAGRVFQEGSGHGEFKEAKVVIRDREHPITRGVTDFVKWDEFYHNLLDKHQTPIHVLASYYSDPDPGFFLKGTGKDEPCLFTTEYGKGRVVHQVLGHVAASEVYPGYIGCTMIAFIYEPFQRLLIQGAEWAATGKVTDIPDSAFIRTANAAFYVGWRTQVIEK